MRADASTDRNEHAHPNSTDKNRPADIVEQLQIAGLYRYRRTIGVSVIPYALELEANPVAV
jgi:hypothetical protein